MNDQHPPSRLTPGPTHSCSNDGTDKPRHETVSAPTTAPSVVKDTGIAAARTGPALRPSGVLLPEALPAPFGRYELRQRLGRGGMGSVFLAHDSQLDRLVALKIPVWAGQEDPTLTERFFREARAAAALVHPNICPVHETGQIDGIIYLTMAYIEGQPLDKRLSPAQPWLPRDAAALVRTVALAMQEAHDRGIVHRDLKPANIMLDRRQQPIVMDFGLALQSVGQDMSRLTQSGLILGTPAYMSPEQAGGDLEAIGPASDVYSLGVILYELLTGRVPFQAATFGKLVAQIERDPPPPPTALRADLDPALEALCLKALAKEPQQRHASMAALAAALGPFALGTSIPTVSEARPAAKAARPPTRWRRWLIGLGGAAAAVLAAVVFYVATDHGTLEFHLNDPAADVLVKVDGNEVRLTHAGETVRLRVGPHKLEVTGKNFETVSESFRIKRGDKTVLQVILRPKQELVQKKAEPPPVEKKSALPAKAPNLVLPPERQLTAEERARVDELVAEGFLAGRKGHFQEAISLATAALALDPRSAVAYELRSRAYDQLGRYDKVIVEASLGLRCDPNMASLYRCRANAHTELEMYAEAVQDATRALELDPNNALNGRVLGNRGVGYAGSGELQKALTDFNNAENLLPGVAMLHWQRSFVHQKLGNKGQAEADRQRAVALDRSFASHAPPPWLNKTPRSK